MLWPFSLKIWVKPPNTATELFFLEQDFKQVSRLSEAEWAVKKWMRAQKTHG